MPLPGFPDYVSRVSRATEAHYEGFALTN
jgi:hypothetical protein